MRTMRNLLWASVTLLSGMCVLSSAAASPDWPTLEQRFRELPMEARRLTGPLFWLHGDESPERLRQMLDVVAESGNGCFTAESRPHNDWLGPNWYRDLAICLKKARELDLKMWIFDERWWPSQMVGGKVPPEFGSKILVANAVEVDGPKAVTLPDCGGPTFIGVLAGRDTDDGVDGSSLIELAPHVVNGTLSWNAPAGRWKVMTFHWAFAGAKGMQKRWIAVDGASPDCVDWFIKTVYQPHYDHFKDDFGKTIPGYFYDEPETPGDWGTDLMTLLAERKIDWKKPFVAWKFKLAGEENVAARYQYADAFAESWGRTMYGGMSAWCRAHGVVSMGHFMEHGDCLFSRGLCAGNMFQLQKYSDMGGIDLVCRQFYPGQKKLGLWQMAKLGSSISHVYGKADDLAMCEIFGAYGQDITYPQMKWLTDQMLVRGINYFVPHSFNPRAPHDRDCPPYFYNGGFEPRYPLYRVYADYTSRLSLLLSGGRHVAPVAFLFLGQSYHAGKKLRPDELTDALDDALFDCDWMPYDAFAQARIEGNELLLHDERFRILIVPAAEVIPYETLAKAKAFFDAGGIVVGYGFLPSKSATLGKTSADIAALVEPVWGRNPQPGTKAVKTNAQGGRAYFLAAKPSPDELRAALTDDAGYHPCLEVLQGKTDRWLHVLHRVKSERDVFLVCNQNHQGDARRFVFRVRAAGEPEAWDAMRNTVTAVPYKRVDSGTVDVTLTLEPSESVLLVFGREQRTLPPRYTAEAKPRREPIEVVRDRDAASEAPALPGEEKAPAFDGCRWVWYPEGNPAAAAPAGTRWFRKQLELPAGHTIRKASFAITADNHYALYVNGQAVGKDDGDIEGWRTPQTHDVTAQLAPGANALAIAAANALDQPNPAGLIGVLKVEFADAKPLIVPIDETWKTSNHEEAGWQTKGFDDARWTPAKAVAAYGQAPWGRLGGRGARLTLSPMTNPDPYRGHCTVPADIDLTACRVVLEMDELPAPEEAAAVRVNGAYAGGTIGRPFRVDVTRCLKPGENEIVIQPMAPKNVKLAVYESPTP